MPTREEPTLVTTAPVNPGDERRSRERRYLITMAFRVVAIIVAIVFATGWIRIVAIIFSCVLPWVAVVAANSAPRQRVGKTPSLYSPKGPRELR